MGAKAAGKKHRKRTYRPTPYKGEQRRGDIGEEDLSEWNGAGLHLCGKWARCPADWTSGHEGNSRGVGEPISEKLALAEEGKEDSYPDTLCHCRFRRGISGWSRGSPSGGDSQGDDSRVLEIDPRGRGESRERTGSGNRLEGATQRIRPGSPDRGSRE